MPKSASNIYLSDQRWVYNDAGTALTRQQGGITLSIKATSAQVTLSVVEGCERQTLQIVKAKCCVPCAVKSCVSTGNNYLAVCLAPTIDCSKRKSPWAYGG